MVAAAQVGVVNRGSSQRESITLVAMFGAFLIN